MPSIRRFFTPLGLAVRPDEGPVEPGKAITPGAFYYFLLIIGLNGLVARILGLYMPLYLKEIGFSGMMTGLYFSVSAVSTIILSLPVGISTDRLSIRHIMAVSFLLVALSRFGLIISTSFPVICGFAFFGSFGVRFYMTATNSLFFKVTGPDNLRKAGQFQALRMVAMGGGLIIGSLVIGFYSFRHAFIVTVAANLALAIMALLLPRTGQVSLKLEEYREAIFTPQVLFIALVFTLSSLHWGAEMVAYTPFLREVLQLSMTHTGLYTGIGFFFVGAGAYLGVILIEKKWVTSLQTVLVLGFLLSGIFHILMVIPNPWWSFAFRMLHEVGDGLVFVVFYHGIARVFKLDRIGGCAAFMSLCMGLGSVGSSVLFGHISDLYGYQWPLIISGVVMVLVPILLRLSPYSRMEQEEAV